MHPTIPNDLMDRIQHLLIQANLTQDAIGKEIVLQEIARLEADALCKLEADADKLIGIFLRALRALAGSI